MKVFLKLLLLLFITFGCSTNSLINRTPSAITDEITYYLSLDKFKYYTQEYAIAMSGKVPDKAILAIENLSVEEIIAMKISPDDLANAESYDHLIFQYINTLGLTDSNNEESFKWNYNFFRNKLNEAFTLSPSKLDIDLSMTPKAAPRAEETTVPLEHYAVEDMTLDSGHYISNRTTRAIFWDAIEHNHTIEFHLGDSRTFLKGLKEHHGEILFEVKPLAKNYNKIFVVQYPDEDTYRYAITNIGGKDRLDHLTNQIALSNINKRAISAKVVIDGNIEKFQAAKTLEHTTQLQLLPHADRVIIGQKESIDGKFYLFWKMKALKNLYDEEPDLFLSVDPKLLNKYQTLKNASLEAIFKDKKTIEDMYDLFAKDFEQRPKFNPPLFKVYNYDNFTIEMCDYVFTNSEGKDVRWRVLSNVWGDEITPIAKALKNTGHTNVTYMGTAGAFSDKGYKVGDLVAPNQKAAMKIEGAKYGGNVEHVGSPFEETKNWLELARARSDFVEVETSYLQKIFNGPNDHLEMFLLVSDILGSDTETLANASSAKRKNAQNKLLAALFQRDSLGPPIPRTVKAINNLESKRNIILNALSKKSVSYRYYIYSKMKNTNLVTEDEVLKFAEKEPAFTDKFIIDRLVKMGELVHDLHYQGSYLPEFEIAFSKSLVEGTWNPKTEKMQVVIKTKNNDDVNLIQKALSNNQEYLNQMSTFVDFSVSTDVNSPGLIWMKKPEVLDQDFFVKIYSEAGFLNEGLYHSITYNGNITLDMLPTQISQEPLKKYFQGTALHTSHGESCIETIKNFFTHF